MRFLCLLFIHSCLKIYEALLKEKKGFKLQSKIRWLVMMVDARGVMGCAKITSLNLFVAIIQESCKCLKQL